MLRRRILWVFYFAVFIKSSTYGVMFTMLDDYRDRFGISEGGLGLVVAVGFFTSFAAQLLIAPLADRGHAKRLMLLGHVLAVGGALTMGFGTTLGALLAGRVLAGIGVGTALPALRRAIIVTDPDNLGRNLGLILSMEVAGFASGPVLSTILVGPFGIPAPYLVSGALMAAAAVAIAGTRIAETAREDAPTERFALDLLRIPAVASGVLIGVTLFFMIGIFDSLWVLVMDDMGSPSWMANVGISVFVIPMIFMGPFGGRFVQRVGPFRAGGTGMLVGAACMCGYGVLPSAWLMMVAFLVHTLNDGLTVTGAGVATASSAPLERQAGAQGLLGGMETLAGGIAAMLAGVSYEAFGRTVTFVGTAAIMVALLTAARVLAGDAWGRRDVRATSGDGGMVDGGMVAAVDGATS
ncbi:MAG: MFS transporter [Acidimicrobiia bacterium]